MFNANNRKRIGSNGPAFGKKPKFNRRSNSSGPPSNQKPRHGHRSGSNAPEFAKKQGLDQRSGKKPGSSGSANKQGFNQSKDLGGSAKKAKFVHHDEEDDSQVSFDEFDESPVVKKQKTPASVKEVRFAQSEGEDNQSSADELPVKKQQKGKPTKALDSEQQTKKQKTQKKAKKVSEPTKKEPKFVQHDEEDDSKSSADELPVKKQQIEEKAKKFVESTKALISEKPTKKQRKAQKKVEKTKEVVEPVESAKTKAVQHAEDGDSQPSADELPVKKQQKGKSTKALNSEQPNKKPQKAQKQIEKVKDVVEPIAKKLVESAKKKKAKVVQHTEEDDSQSSADEFDEPPVKKQQKSKPTKALDSEQPAKKQASKQVKKVVAPKPTKDAVNVDELLAENERRLSDQSKRSLYVKLPDKLNKISDSVLKALHPDILHVKRRPKCAFLLFSSEVICNKAFPVIQKARIKKQQLSVFYSRDQLSESKNMDEDNSLDLKKLIVTDLLNNTTQSMLETVFPKANSFDLKLDKSIAYVNFAKESDALEAFKKGKNLKIAFVPVVVRFCMRKASEDVKESHGKNAKLDAAGDKVSKTTKKTPAKQSVKAIQQDSDDETVSVENIQQDSSDEDMTGSDDEIVSAKKKPGDKKGKKMPKLAPSNDEDMTDSNDDGFVEMSFDGSDFGSDNDELFDAAELDGQFSDESQESDDE